MKRLIFAFTAILSMTVEAQNITDAVRYSTSDLNGTARYRAMSGAFGALGGDLSSIDVNPAGSAVFLNGIAGLSLNIENSDNEVRYMNGFSSNSNSNFDLGQAGAAFVFNSTNEENDWKKFSLAFNYSKTADFEDDFLAKGMNDRTFNNYFLGYAQGIPLDLLTPLANESVSDLYSYLGEEYGFGAQQAYLGYEAFLFEAEDPNDMTNTNYISAIEEEPGSFDFDQEYSYAATGLNGKFSFNFATQYQDFLYLGINLNSHFINYDRITSMDEINSNEENTISRIYFEDRLSTLGSGFSLQLGAITKLGSSLRAGIAYESPTWYTISEETTQYLKSYSELGNATVDPRIVNVYPDYKLQTAPKYTGSLAYLFGDQALISFDYSYKDYSVTKFKPKGDPDFSYQNDLMGTELQGASIFRLGGEYRIEGWSLRGGYRFEESPYANGNTIGDLEGYSVGLGYNFGNITLDVAYDSAEQDRNPQLYKTGLTNTANINRSTSNVVLSVNFKI
ncbi:OmpP1/FadL family transporter [Salinimicrobium flavum]|uniref:OmpP1/FadL family transporter n=1 Tax=Salinimicrobium flavum TaxID=1737065 RepID=A0ABW5IZG5_9FLAO